MSTAVAEDLSAENPLVEGLERLPVHSTALVIFGATGDLAQRKLLPALYNLAHEGSLPERFELIGIARSGHSDDEFREVVRESITRFSRRKPDKDVLDGLLCDLRYVPGSFDDPEVYERLQHGLQPDEVAVFFREGQGSCTHDANALMGLRLSCHRSDGQSGIFRLSCHRSDGQSGI